MSDAADTPKPVSKQVWCEEVPENWRDWQIDMRAFEIVKPNAPMPLPYMQPTQAVAKRLTAGVAEGQDVIAEAGWHPENQYLLLLDELVGQRHTRQTRNDDGTRSLFGRQMRFDMKDGFPILTTKSVFWKGVVAELLWFIRGDTNVKYLHDHGVHIWDEWADENGELGPVYGAQWRGTCSGIDQFANLIKGLKENPYSRRHMVDSWQVAHISDMALPPCHCLFQFYVGSDQRLHMQLYQRSADIFLGVPFNIASYALLLHIVARSIDRLPGEFIHTLGDVHIYEDHMDQARVQLQRTPSTMASMYVPMNYDQEPMAYIESLKVEDAILIGYKPQGKLPAPVSK